MTLDYDSLDPGIRELVRFLRSHGFDTCDSGDGRSKPPEACWIDRPHVICRCTAEGMVSEADRLFRILAELKLQGQFEINTSYDPADGCAVLMLFDLDDAQLAAATRPLPN